MASMRTLTPLIAILLVCSPLAGCLDALSGNDPPTAQMSMNPSENIRTDNPVTFSAAGSSDPDGDSMTFTWTFGDGNTGTGLTTSHTYVQPGEYVVRLSVGDGTYETSISESINVLDSSAREPNAEISANKDNDCDGRVDEGCVMVFAGTGVAGGQNGARLQAQFDNPVGIAADSKGNIYVSEYGGHRIRKIDTAGNVTTYAGTGVSGFKDGSAAQAQFSYPYGLAFDRSDNLYVVDRGNRRIRKITPAGVVSTLAGDGQEGNQDGAGNQASFSMELSYVAVDIKLMTQFIEDFIFYFYRLRLLCCRYFCDVLDPVKYYIF